MTIPCSIRHLGPVPVAALLVGLLAGAISSPLAAAAQSTQVADPSDVVIALDFSGSIMRDRTTRLRFARALDGIADRIDETGKDLLDGDATFSFLAFASDAVSYPKGCSELQTRDSTRNVSRLADCFRQVARQYRLGTAAPVTRLVGVETDYVDALRLADQMLPDDAERPALVFFTDGEHAVRGRPASEVLPTAQRLFGDLVPFALLPVGMGLKADGRQALQDGLAGLRDLTNNMESCPGGEEFGWPDVVFETAQDAGQAVSLALRKVTCTFPTLQPVATPEPSPTPEPPAAPAAPVAPSVRGGDGTVAIVWVPPANLGTEPLERYDARCRPEGGAWLETQTVGPESTTVAFTSVENGTAYECEVRAVSAAGASDWSGGSARPAGAPQAPLGLTAEGRDQGALLRVQPGPDGGDAVTDHSFECSPVGTTAWAPVSDTGAPVEYTVSGLQNETSYTCRAYALNRLGASAPSPPSNEFFACSGLLQCNPWLILLLQLLTVLLLVGLVFWVWQTWRTRNRRYISAQVDSFPAVELGMGPDVNILFMRDRRGRIADIMSGPPDSDIRVRFHGGKKFTVTGAGDASAFRAGEPGSVVDAGGDTHQLTLRPARRPYSPGPAYDEASE